MEAVHRFLAFARADLLERVRSTRFWVLLALIAGAAWWCFPPVDAKYMILGLGGGQYRGMYSSTWIGMVLSMLCIWLSLAGFYMVRGSLARDIETGVWQLLVATTMRRPTYLLAKWFSNVLMLSLVLAAAALVGVAAQLVRAEGSSPDLVELLKPLILLGLPTLGMTATFALVFDLVPPLRRTAGNVLYLVIWILMLASTQQSLRSEQGWIGDPFGVAVFDRAARQELEIDIKPGFCLACGMKTKRPILFAWQQWQPAARDVTGRAFWLALGLGVVAFSAGFLDRAAAHVAPVKGEGGGRELRWLAVILRPLHRSQGGTLLALELQLALRQRQLWWWLAMLATWAFQALGSSHVGMLAVLAAWLLSLDVYARLALREQMTRTGQVVFSNPGGRRRVLAVRSLMLLVLGLAAGLPALLRFGLPVAVVALSIAIWALALGALTRNPRTFELLMAAGAYLAIDGLPVFTLMPHLALLPVAAVLLVLTTENHEPFKN